MPEPTVRADGDDAESVRHLVDEVTNLCGAQVASGDDHIRHDEIASLVAAVDELAGIVNAPPSGRDVDRCIVETAIAPTTIVSTEERDEPPPSPVPDDPAPPPDGAAVRDEARSPVVEIPAAPASDEPAPMPTQPATTEPTIPMEAESAAPTVLPARPASAPPAAEPESEAGPEAAVEPAPGVEDAGDEIGDALQGSMESVDEVLATDDTADTPVPLPAAEAPSAETLPVAETRPAAEAPAAAEPLPASDAVPAPAETDDVLRDMDEELADDVDELLRGSFETVSAVLDDEFGDPAATADVAPAPAATAATPAEDDDHAEPTVPAASEPALEPDADPLLDDDRFKTVEELIQAEEGSGDAEPDAGFESRQPEAAAGDGTFEPLEAMEADESSSNMLPTRTTKPPPPAEPAPAATVATTEDADDPPEVFEPVEPSVDEVPDDPPAEIDDPVPAGGVEPGLPTDDLAEEEPPTPGDSAAVARARRLAAVLAVALRLVNYPLRWVPPPARPIVDWIALSLVFWVPIVWVLVLFVF